MILLDYFVITSSATIQPTDINDNAKTDQSGVITFMAVHQRLSFLETRF